MDVESSLTIGLRGVNIPEEELERLALRVAEIIERVLESRIGMRFLEDLEVVVRLDREESGELTLTVDLSFSAPRALGVDYELVIDEALKRACSYLEDRLRAYVVRARRGASGGLGGEETEQRADTNP